MKKKSTIPAKTIVTIEYHHQIVVGILIQMNTLDYKIQLTKGVFIAGNVEFIKGDLLTVPIEFSKVS